VPRDTIRRPIEEAVPAEALGGSTTQELDGIEADLEEIDLDELSIAELGIEQPEPAAGRLTRLRRRLARSQSTLGRGLLALMSRDTVDAATWDEVEETLLSADYGKKRAGLIDMKRASTEHRPGDAFKGGALLDPSEHLLPAPWGRGTVHVDAVDAQGNMASFTPSGAWIPSSPVIPALGFPLGNRLMTFYLSPSHHPNRLAPGKRPFHTIIPAFLTQDGQPVMSFGVMGGNMQPQGHMQTVVRMLDHQQNPQAACDAPRWRFNQGLEIMLMTSMRKPSTPRSIQRFIMSYTARRTSGFSQFKSG
jgi:gamma-glutamyltranspeptidase